MRVIIIGVLFSFLQSALYSEQANTISVDQLQERYNFSKTEDAVAGRITLTTEQKNIVFAIGMKTVLLDGKAYTLKTSPTFSDGKILVPDEMIGLLEGNSPSAIKPAISIKPSSYKFKVVIDPGHGGVHDENKGKNGVYEKDVNLDVSLKLAKMLQDQGIKVCMTRTKDKELSRDIRDDLERRVAFCNRENPDIFVSIHSNHARTSLTRGFEVFVARGYNSYTTDSLALAQCIRRAFARGLDIPDRGIKERDFYVIKWSRAPAVLVELDFLSNPTSAKELGDESYREKLAELLAEGINKFLSTRKSIAEHRSGK